MTHALTRRLLLSAGAALALMTSAPAMAQSNVPLRFSAVFSQQDIRAEMMERFAAALGEGFDFQGYYGATLFRQGTELVALQRGNLEMGNIAPQDISEQLPEWSVLTSAYLFRDADHLVTFFQSEAGEQMKQLAEDRLNIRVLGPTYFGVRHVGLRGDRAVNTPADLAGVRLRMPGGDSWQFLGQALGANPTPVAYAEVYTALQTGAIDGQDNPMPNVQNMKFYEVMDQIVKTAHLVGFDVLTISKSSWDSLTPEQQAQVQAAADEAIAWSNAQHLQNEADLIAFFEGEGLAIVEPDLDAFRTHAQELYQTSGMAARWPEGIVEQINGL
ncbi:TRAP transporter substrate-binding protein DctP [Ketogulonicigenium vulgare]|uniref:TRAP dicarboxylate transporter-DctP subunit n=1 Tax=Ketogulonicigenium vulgare (strain WSH-001) TaxID=759362 RepID=F9Y728_KETVW|nr:TRAP transporter substrate-binding protein DctP [Ketogulonicigenium vulgare]ADO41221.1 C4-dicarboxylate-binding periplasmic protein [Ketogulonicigenium vulgare Y25]AEM42218.1 TRAP dicarboxylate transporter-DctP subunit [Ketogulonicigenium vulgare WSH-001]ALJ79841.1 C4-dicarboxylate ABC transporter [Ketogulonicigenium vulgare]ANW32749.1 C4-dicarboxylate ABC transporter [Ketogulonicigenium vulgare]AOZ53051.1 C4-dicarboxylate-binding periplasmic protein [Ketogulonicigenium vulgare]